MNQGIRIIYIQHVQHSGRKWSSEDTRKEVVFLGRCALEHTVSSLLTGSRIIAT
ncbi:Nucleolar protein 6 [Clarias magur]|uniref:Nucleolar protein 6 n=1 Tax=Clarias magur TaxID=1594786 RepID=A0A8J4URU4_CLAMG|nr:Nucleolar protein 6 [Clarias magur]